MPDCPTQRGSRHSRLFQHGPLAQPLSRSAQRLFQTLPARCQRSKPGPSCPSLQTSLHHTPQRTKEAVRMEGPHYPARPVRFSAVSSPRPRLEGVSPVAFCCPCPRVHLPVFPACSVHGGSTLLHFKDLSVPASSECFPSTCKLPSQ